MKEYYMLLGLNQKGVKIMDVEENNGIIEVGIENKGKKVRCPNLISLLQVCMEGISQYGANI